MSAIEKTWPEVLSQDVQDLIDKYKGVQISPETYATVLADIRKLPKDTQIEFLYFQICMMLRRP
jgi:hypothetical protein